MAQVNTRTSSTPVYTHEGAKAQKVNPYLELRRSVMTCMLWENTFYESGSDIADRISALVQQVDPGLVCVLARDARDRMYLRHVPLFLACELAKRPGPKPYLAELLFSIIQRPDELTEFLAIYWKDAPTPRPKGFKPLASSVKRGLAAAFRKFSAYQLAKYNRDSKVKLRDVLFLTHPDPKSAAQVDVWRQLVDGTLAPPDTWEVALSAGKDKKATWERLLREGKLGGLAVLRNLRNMQKVDVDESLIRSRLSEGIKKALPFRFVTAATHAPRIEDAIEAAMLKGLEGVDALPGKTGLLIDVSGSMDANLSDRGETRRIDAAAGLAIYLREKTATCRVATFSADFVEVPPRRGFALRDAIHTSQDRWKGTYLGKAVAEAGRQWKDIDRFIVITDEQSHDTLGQAPSGMTSYLINVAPYKNGISYGNGFTHLDGWSERVLDFIIEKEMFDKAQGPALN